MNALRGLVAVLGGLTVIRLLVTPLELTLVNALALQPNAPALMAARLFYTGAASVLGGYLTARIAAHDPMRYTIIAAAFLALILIAGFASGLAPGMPLWIQAALVVVSALGLLAGGAIRSAVATLPPTPRGE